MKPRYYYDECWKMTFWFFIGWKPKEVEKNLRLTFDFDDLKLDGAGKSIHFKKENGIEVIALWLKDKPNNPKSLGVLVHECVHAALFCLKSRGVCLTEENECVAYLTEALTRIILTEGKRKN